MNRVIFKKEVKNKMKSGNDVLYLLKLPELKHSRLQLITQRHIKNTLPAVLHSHIQLQIILIRHIQCQAFLLHTRARTHTHTHSQILYS
jgi:hypothetical protein